jgi:Family of unknown function (DUF5908)
MAVYISEIITESVLPPPSGGTAATGAQQADADIDLIVRRAVERVLEVLRREWDR